MTAHDTLHCEDCTHTIPDHPTVDVDGVPIDELLVPLITILWALNIRTSECCQASSKIAHFDDEDEEEIVDVAQVSFFDLENADRFVNLLARGLPDYVEDDLQWLSDEFTEHGFRIYVWYQGGGGQLMPTVVVEFPTEKIGEITAGIKKYLADLS